MNGTATHLDNKFSIRAGYDVDLVAAIKNLPGRHWDGETKTWTMSVTPEAVEFVDTLEAGWNIRVEPETRKFVEDWKERATSNRSDSSKAATDFQLPPGLEGQPFPFQLVGAEFAFRNQRVLIADEMGLGKTIQAIEIMHLLELEQPGHPAVVVCPASLKLMWERAIQAWLPKLSVLVMSGTKPIEALAAHVLIINYDILYAHLETLKALHPALLICDESHYLKDLKAGRTKSVLELAHGVDHILLLTGTPVLNKPVELWSQLMILKQDKAFGNFWNFARRYCDAHQENRHMKGGGTRMIWNMDGASNLPELNEKLRSVCMIRRLKKDVLKELPPKMPPEIIPVEISNRKKYEKAEYDLIQWLRENKRLDQKFLETLDGLSEEETRSRTAGYRASAAERARRAMTIVRINELKWLAALGKIQAVTEWVNSFLETGQKLVVFGWHTDIVNGLQAEFDTLSAPYPIIGDTALADRQTAVDEFQTNPETRLIFLNTRAGGLGLTLTAASNVAFVELDWTPALLQQAEDRCHRIGQTEPVCPHYFIGRNTIDEWMIDILSNKQQISAEALGDATGESAIMSLADYLAEKEG